MIKCTRCGSEVKAKRFCIYCGERLQANEMSVSRVSRAASGILRLRQRSSYSQSALPSAQKSNASKTKMQLASLNSSQTSPSKNMDGREATGGKAMKEVRGKQQSNELEALLEKLNSPVEYEADTVHETETQDWNMDEEIDDNPMASLDISLDGMMSDSYSRSLDDSFFLSNEFDDNESYSGPVPMGSGSFGRVPSGGFKLFLESAKSQCTNWYKKAKNRFQNLGQPKEKFERAQQQSTIETNRRRKQYIGLGIAIAAITLLFIVSLTLVDNSEITPEIAAQPKPHAEQNNFELIALEEPIDDISEFDFEADDFSIPMLDTEQLADVDEDVEAQALGLAPTPIAKAKSAETNNDSKLTLSELKLYGRNDNVLVDDSQKTAVKLVRACVLREGPASRFGFISELKKGQDIDILTTTDEDWLLERNGLWTKTGQSPRLGPGNQFAKAVKGMSLPQPRSRVISSKNWRYVRSDKTYGYVGPACFK